MTIPTSSSGKSGKDARHEREKTLILKHKYESRITIARMGKESFQAGDFVGAIRKYTEYLDIMAELHKVDSIFDLRPQRFDPQKDLTEMLMLSHIYFELAKVYDATGKFNDECGKCLDQFVIFSANQPYQVVNSEMIRKHLRKFKFKNQENFNQAYRQIFVQSRKCFIATLCFGDGHVVTNDLRQFKQWMLRYRWGPAVVHCYYFVSEPLVAWLSRNSVLRIMFVGLARPALHWFSVGPLRRIILK